MTFKITVFVIVVLLYSYGFKESAGKTPVLLTSWWSADQTIIKKTWTNSDLLPIYFNMGLSMMSPVEQLEAEQLRLSVANPQFTLGDRNGLLEFMNSSLRSHAAALDEMYPRDDVVVRMAIKLMQNLYPSGRTIQNILIITNQTFNHNNPDINNYETIITYLNLQNWREVFFLPFTNVDDVVTYLRVNEVYDIITFLSDPKINKQMIEKMYLENFFVWKYRWLIFDLLGGVSYMTERKYREGCVSNNVTIVTFAKDGQSGQTRLMKGSHDLVVEAKTGSASIASTTTIRTGVFSVTGRKISRKSFVFQLIQNPGVLENADYGSVTVDLPAGYNGVVGAITVSSGVTYQPLTLNFTTSRDFMKKRDIWIGINNSPPYCYFNQAGEPTGFMVELLKQVMQNLNVSYKFIRITIEQEGDRFNYSTRKFSGLLEKVQSGEVDFLAIPIIETIARLSNFNFVSNFLSGYITGIYKAPNVGRFRAVENYLLPFSWQAWVTFLGAAVGVTLAIAIADAVFPDPARRYRLPMSLFFSVSSLTHGAYFDPPSKRGPRIIMSFWWAFCLLVVILWAANYTALLAKEKAENRLESFFGLLDQNKYTYGTLDDGLLFNFLEKDPASNAQLMLRLLRDELPTGVTANLDDALRLVKSSSYALLYDDKTLKYLANTECLDTFGRWVAFDFGIALPKHSEMFPALSTQINALIARGVVSNLIEKYWPATNSSCESQNILYLMTREMQKLIKNPYRSSLNAEYMIAVFAILVLGGLIILTLACIERIVRLIVQKNQERRERSRINYTLTQLQL